MIKKELCWNITSKCNQHCIYCFRDKISQDCTLRENMDILQYIVSKGVSELTWSGGEPLLYDGIDILLRTAFEHKIINKINTNASLLSKEYLNKIADYIDTFTLSLDTCNPNVNENLGRGYYHQYNVYTTVNQIKKYYPTKTVTINVVVNRLNINTMDELIRNLNNLPIDGVRLFQVSPIRGQAIDTFEKTSITQTQFAQARELFLTNLTNKNVTFRDKTSLEKEYLIITPSGNLCYNDNGKDILIKQLRGINR